MQPTPRQNAEMERQFQTVLLAVIALLQREQRVTYRTLTYLFGLDEALLEEVRDELTLRQVTHEEHGKVLVWTGAAPPVLPPAVVGSSQLATVNTDAVTSLATPPLPPHVLPPAASSSTPAGCASSGTERRTSPSPAACPLCP